jgi:hypothetical protein
MIFRTQDSLITMLKKRIAAIIDEDYRSAGLRTSEIRQYLSYPKNFKLFVKKLSTLEELYKKRDYPVNFSTEIHHLLFDVILMDRIYYEKDEDDIQNEKVIVRNYSSYLNKKSVRKVLRVDENELNINETAMNKLTDDELYQIIEKYGLKGDKLGLQGEKEASENYLELCEMYKDILKKRKKCKKYSESKEEDKLH